MANPTHLAKFKEGPKAWNKWRKENKIIIPDLSNADLTACNPFYMPGSTTEIIYADLSDYNLSKTNLTKSTLKGVKLREANLSAADLSNADLFEADLRNANLKKAILINTKFNVAQLQDANLYGANLSNAELTEARLKRVNLKNANLNGVDADYVSLVEANLAGADLSNAKMMDANCPGANMSNAKLCGIDLLGANLREVNFSKSDLTKADLSQSNCNKATFQGANLLDANLALASFSKVNFSKANCSNIHAYNAFMKLADLSNCNLENAYLYGVNFSESNLSKANLKSANLNRAILVKTNMEGCTINNAAIYGISVWDIIGEPKNQNDLIITPKDLPEIMVDELEVAQFVYLLLNNSKIRNAIDTITSKAVLILGRFYKERKEVLDALRDELRKRNYVPIVFDFEKPNSKDLTETVQTLAQLSRFVIADITDAKSIPQELSHIIPNSPSLPIVSIIDKKFRQYAMYEHFENYPWVLPLYEYKSQKQLLSVIKEKIIIPAEKKVEELKQKK